MNIATVKLIAALAQAGATGYAGFAETGAQEEATETNAELYREKMAQDQEQFDEEMRLKRRQQKETEKTSAMTMLANLDTMRKQPYSTATRLGLLAAR